MIVNEHDNYVHFELDLEVRSFRRRTRKQTRENHVDRNRHVPTHVPVRYL